jgi:DNA-binding beta-propeller fold protein YncE
LNSVIIIATVSVCSLFILFPNVYATGIDFQYQYKETWKHLGESSPTMLQGIVIDSNDDLYVIDSNQLIKLTTTNEILWTIIFDFNLSGELFLNQNNEILVVVSDEEVDEIRKYSQLGELVKTWNIDDFDILIDHYIYIDTQENIYITEWIANPFDDTNIIGDVKKFDSSGNLLKNYEDMGLLKLKDDPGNLYTTEPGKIVKYDPNGHKITEFGKQEYRGGIGTFFEQAESIIVDSTGLIFATGGEYGPINIFDEEGNFSGIGDYGWGSKTYGYPMGIALDSQNNAYVTDYSRNTILVYERIPLEYISQNNSSQTEGGGCLIATATYGSEMALEVQQLRELRDNTLLNTESGIRFMNTFNDVYYSFSPIIADMQRENLVFKEIVKIAITPIISSLSILNYVDMNSESEVLGYGISLIILNLGMYLGIPTVVIIGIRKRF